jgi:iron complex transport system substrate-binding protein
MSSETTTGAAGARRRALLPPTSAFSTSSAFSFLAALTVPLLALAGCASSPTSSGPDAPDKTVSTVSTASMAADGVASASGPGASSGDVAGFPATVTGGNGPVTIPSRPHAVVSLSPSITEMLYAAGAGGQVKAVDDQSNQPAEAPRTKLSGFRPNTEAVVGYDPDLVIVANDSNGLVAGLMKLRIPVLLLPAPSTLEEAFAQQLTIGAATGHVQEAKASVERTRQRLDTAIASVPKAARPLKIYHEIDQTYYSATSKTFIGGLYARFGLQNIADSAPKVAGGYPQLSAEFVVAAAPDIIVLADGNCCGQSPEAVAKRPAFTSVPAVARHKVIAIDDDIASRWGPRVADFAETLAKTLRGA